MKWEDNIQSYEAAVDLCQGVGVPVIWHSERGAPGTLQVFDLGEGNGFREVQVGQSLSLVNGSIQITSVSGENESA